MSGTDARGYWERNASRYDASARLIGRPLPRMLELVSGAVDVADRVLEVAAGTGIVTIAIAGRAKEVVATDYAAAMVEMLERRVRSEGLENCWRRAGCKPIWTNRWRQCRRRGRIR